ncbi:hypothetical protein SLNWT_3107 [Streptomyces albus]|uniref:Uncharacterized protein n=1 Tax=Streptomyces albus (strain ATCC 21838 / DSM 41398 / FERM P-419 / JCM 4703 / NBRC 107858) TaxID=1081613 RepID=A0A0B5EM09_STRA4|nr:hypothetical protein SLNWT_3107 [Streptomyces albus]
MLRFPCFLCGGACASCSRFRCPRAIACLRSVSLPVPPFYRIGRAERKAEGLVSR